MALHRDDQWENGYVGFILACLPVPEGGYAGVAKFMERSAGVAVSGSWFGLLYALRM
jgi:hypothetical protein